MKYRIVRVNEPARRYEDNSYRTIDYYYIIQKRILFWWFDYTEPQGFPFYEPETVIFETEKEADAKLNKLIAINVKPEIQVIKEV